MDSTAQALSYALAKQLQTAHTLATSYGELDLDEELRQVIERAVRPVLEQRLAELLAGGLGPARAPG